MTQFPFRLTQLTDRIEHGSLTQVAIFEGQSDLLMRNGELRLEFNRSIFSNHNIGIIVWLSLDTEPQQPTVPSSVKEEPNG